MHSSSSACTNFRASAWRRVLWWGGHPPPQKPFVVALHCCRFHGAQAERRNEASHIANRRAAYCEGGLEEIESGTKWLLSMLSLRLS